MHRILAPLAASIVLVGTLRCEEHLLPPEVAQRTLVSATTKRQEQLAAIDGLLARPEAKEAAKRLGADLQRVRSAAKTLSDSELDDLAVRAAALQADPTAGLTHDVEELLIIFLIVAIVILVLKAVS